VQWGGSGWGPKKTSIAFFLRYFTPSPRFSGEKTEVFSLLNFVSFPFSKSPHLKSYLFTEVRGRGSGGLGGGEGERNKNTTQKNPSKFFCVGFWGRGGRGRETC